MSIFAKANLEHVPPYIPGRLIESIREEFGIDNIIKLASNENWNSPSPKVLEALRSALKDVNRYPDPNCTGLKRKLADSFGLSTDNFIFGNGADELINLIVNAFIDPGDEVLMSYPSFPRYFIAARAATDAVIQVPMKDFRHDVDKLLQKVTPKTKILFIDTPSNPVGCKLEKSEQEYIVENFPEQVLLVIDEAYREFVNENECLNYCSVLSSKSNVIFMRTFSKAYSLSGLRIGYCIGNSDVITDINKVRSVFNVNFLGQIAAEAALDDKEFAANSIRSNNECKEYLYKQLKRLGISFQPTFANFIFIDMRRPLEKVDEFFLRHGVIVRPLKFKGFSGQYIRVTIGSMPENKAFIKVLEELISDIPEERHQ